MSTSLSDKLRYQHPDYQAMKDCWRFWEDSSLGGKIFAEGNYLVEHPREQETPKAFQYRKRLSVYEPWGKEIAEDWIGRLYGPGASLSMCDDQVSQEIFKQCKAIESNFDLLGTDMRTFCRNLTKKALTMGSVGVFVDVPPDGRYAKTLYDAQRLNLRAYSRCVHPQNILDWGFDKLGALEWIKLREPASFPRTWQDPFEGQMQVPLNAVSVLSMNRLLSEDNKVYRYFVMDKNKTIRYDPLAQDDWAVSTSEHGLGYIPFMMGYWESPEPGLLFARSPLEDIYYFSDLIYQLRSGVVEVITNQCFSIFIFAANGEQEGKQDILVGTRKALKVPGDGGFPPFFASPDTDIPKVHLETIRSLERAILRMAKGDSRSLIDDGSVKEQSGRSKTYDADEKTSLLRTAADSQETFLTNLLKLVHKRSTINTEEFTGFVRLPDSFSLRGVLQEVEETIALVNALVESPTALKAVKKHLVHSNLQSMLDQEGMAQVDEEIDNASIEELAAAIYANASQQNGSGVQDGLQSESSAGAEQEQTGPTIKRANRRGNPKIGRPGGAA